MLFRSTSFALALVAGLAAAAPVVAHDLEIGDLMIVHPMSRPVLAGRTAAVYMAIANDGDEDERLLGASSPNFDRSEERRVGIEWRCLMSLVGCVSKRCNVV